MHEEKIRISTTENMVAWIVIPFFKMVVAGNLSFFATSTGRDGRSHCRCTYCHLTQKEWSEPTISPINCSILTLNQLKQYSNLHQQSISKPSFKPATKGVIMPPLLDFEPSDYMTPLLHLLIGIVNKGRSSMGHVNRNIALADDTINAIESKEMEEFAKKT